MPAVIAMLGMSASSGEAEHSKKWAPSKKNAEGNRPHFEKVIFSVKNQQEPVGFLTKIFPAGMPKGLFII